MNTRSGFTHTQGLYSCQSHVKYLLHWVLLVVVSCAASSAIAASNDEIGSDAESVKGKFIGAMETEYPDWFKTSFLELSEDVSEAAAEGKRLMLVFHQDGCPYCNAFIERNLAQKDIVETLQRNFDVIEINMWGDREVGSVDGEQYTEKTFSAALNVQFTPTVLFLNEVGQVALRINGYYEPDRFRLALQYVKDKHDESMPFKEFLERHQIEQRTGELIEPDFLSGPIQEMVTRQGKGVRPLLLMFTQKDCSNCQTLHDGVFAREETQMLLDSFDVYQVNLWGNKVFQTPTGQSTTGRQWGKELGVSYAPTLVLFANSGEEVIRSEAWFKAFHTQSILDYVVSDKWREQPSFQRYISARADKQRDQGVDVNIWD